MDPSRGRAPCVALLALFLLLTGFAGTAMANGTLAGQVRDGNTDGAIASATVELISGGSTVASTTTDASGNYSLGGPGGGYTVRFTKGGYGILSVTGVTIVEGQTKTLNMVMYSSPGELTGTVAAAAGGAPIAGANVVANHDFATGVMATGKTAVDGTYDLPGLPPGSYTVTFTASGFTAQTLSIFVASAPPATNLDASMPKAIVPPPPVPTAFCGGVKATIVGTAAAQVLSGTPGRDVIAGLGGKDVIRGLGGRDLICGGNGRDRLVGGAGNDKLLGGKRIDRLAGGRGRDRCVGGAARDIARTCEIKRSI